MPEVDTHTARNYFQGSVHWWKYFIIFKNQFDAQLCRRDLSLSSLLNEKSIFCLTCLITYYILKLYTYTVYTTHDPNLTLLNQTPQPNCKTD